MTFQAEIVRQTVESKRRLDALPEPEVAVTETDTWDPPNMADGAVTSTTINVTGVAVGDPVSASHTAIGANDVNISAHVQAVGVVRVILENRTGGALDIASGTLVVRVWRGI